MNPVVSILVALALSSMALAGGHYGPGPRENIVDSYNNDGTYMNVLNEDRYGPGPAPYGPRHGYGRPSYGGPSYGGPSYGGPSYGAPAYAPLYGPSYDDDVNVNRNANRDLNANANANRDGKLYFSLFLLNVTFISFVVSSKC
jgi:hypothetical protein